MPAKSKSQQRFMGMVYSYKDGTLDTSKLPPELVHKIKNTSGSMTKSEVDDFASTKHKGLPEKKASMNKHIQNGFAAGIIKEALSKQERAAKAFYLGHKKMKKQAETKSKAKKVLQATAISGGAILASYAGARLMTPHLIRRSIQNSRALAL